MRNLSYQEARSRSRLLKVGEYRAELDLRGPGETFLSRTRIAFSCRRPGAGSFVECAAVRVDRIVLNGVQLPVDQVFGGDRIRLDELAEDNVLEVEAVYPYTSDGQGLQRFTDPVDAGVYVYSYAQAHDAHRFLACFDQPDLKASFRLSVRAPGDWTVLGMTPGHRSESGSWDFEPTEPLSTYLFAVAAGNFHEVRGEVGGIPAGLYARRSIAARLDADAADVLVTASACLSSFSDLFGMPYPFRKYDHVFVPEFNVIGMENPGLVMLREECLLDATATYEERQTRAVVLAHEMAHMWFGNLVTPRWWDDLWLNEGFAELLAFLVVAEATEFTSAWTAFCAGRKEWGHACERLPSVHAVVPEIRGTAGVMLHLDGITYAKGAAVLRQLMARLGRVPFLAGVRAVLRRHAYANVSLPDLLAALEEAADEDLEDWTDDWLYTPGVNTLRTVVEETPEGTAGRVAIEQEAPRSHPLERAHTLQVGVYDEEGVDLVKRDRLHVEVSGKRTELPELGGHRRPALLLVNETDEAWATVRLDPVSTATLLRSLGRLEDPTARAVAWQVLWHMTRDAELPVQRFLDASRAALETETDPALAGAAVDRLRQAVDRLGSPLLREERLRRLGPWYAGLARRQDDPCRPVFEAAVVECATTERELADLADRLAAGAGADGTAEDRQAARWRIVTRLAAAGAFGRAEIMAEMARDTTPAGAAAAATALSARPLHAAKEEAFALLTRPGGTSVSLLEAHARGIFRPDQPALARTYASRAVDLLPTLWQRHDARGAARLSRLLLQDVHTGPDVVEQLDLVLGSEPDERLRWLLLDHRADLISVRETRAMDEPR
ncbi:aminopeptidase N [Streptomyces sp. NPDC059104]|uniref:aminopeptidase N n=1 Tax=Streptomyces sp. NPDC059104 TaxID=3346729 RepID=UPI0036B6664F